MLRVPARTPPIHAALYGAAGTKRHYGAVLCTMRLLLKQQPHSPPAANTYFLHIRIFQKEWKRSAGTSLKYSAKAVSISEIVLQRKTFVLQ